MSWFVTMGIIWAVFWAVAHIVGSASRRGEERRRHREIGRERRWENGWTEPAHPQMDQDPARAGGGPPRLAEVECPNPACGGMNPARAKFCRRCGTEVRVGV